MGERIPNAINAAHSYVWNAIGDKEIIGRGRNNYPILVIEEGQFNNNIYSMSSIFSPWLYSIVKYTHTFLLYLRFLSTLFSLHLAILLSLPDQLIRNDRPPLSTHTTSYNLFSALCGWRFSGLWLVRLLCLALVQPCVDCVTLTLLSLVSVSSE